MENTHIGSNSTTSSGAGAGAGLTSLVGEVRKLHIVYFISRLGRIEHPHLIRVNHVSRSGVRLRDVKRWLSELRGKDMSESYSWSYKRKYKAGYVWQDLMDDDLITPISDNEYVLKGSEIPSSRIDLEPTTIEKKTSASSPAAKESPENETEKTSHPIKMSSEIDQESPPFSSNASTITDDSIRTEEDSNNFKSNKPNQEQSSNLETTPSLYSILFQKRNKSKTTRNDVVQGTPAPAPAGMFRNWIRCGNVENHESAVVVINRRKKVSESDSIQRLDGSVGCGSMSCRSSTDVGNRSSIDKLGGSRSQRVLRTNQPWEKNGYFNTRSCLESNLTSNEGEKGSKKCEKKEEDSTAQRPISTSYRYKPINGPNCSQCGKKFKPDKLHTHMKSCKGMKASTTKDINPRVSSMIDDKDEPIYKESSCGLYLTLEAPK
ncbi:protein SOSEKI 1 [Impatiens glandulifera]|uniref:protein SOSEKI 1 n=1 Tax=Impatiens glandulifera TaxID=253017 RepID=UPI001FB13F90|nr:protein SOSEKI 1 [Impatiens glandulifera]